MYNLLQSVALAVGPAYIAGGSLNNTLLMPSGMGLYGNLNISTFGLTA